MLMREPDDVKLQQSYYAPFPRNTYQGVWRSGQRAGFKTRYRMVRGFEPLNAQYLLF